MKRQTLQLKVLTTLVLVAGSALFSRAAVVVTFGETVPVSNIITSYSPSSEDGLGWVNLDDSPNPAVIRNLGQSFITPGDSDYLMQAISMKLALAVTPSFSSPSTFTIDLYELSSAGQNPITGSLVASQSGTMEPTTASAPAGSYFTMTLGTPVALEMDAIYGYVLSFADTTAYNRLIVAISSSQPDPSGTRVSHTNTGTVYNETSAYYIQGTAVPEPGSIAMLALAGMVLLSIRSRNLRRTAEGRA